MTNKQAQITINAIKFMLDNAQYSDDVEEALNMAISALTEQSETHSCDLIDRRALMKEFSDFVRASNNSDFAPNPTWNDAVSLVGSMPPAQPSSSCAHENDSISRQAAIAAANRADYTGLTVEDVKKVTDEVVKELKKLPPAQPASYRQVRLCQQTNGD